MVDDFKILVVEDDVILRKMLTSLFAKIASVFEAESGSAAIAFLKSNHVDLIFSDICMPNGSGTELLHWTQAFYKTPPATVLVTGQAYFPDDSPTLAGAYALVEKPFKVKDLMFIASQVRAEIESGVRKRSTPGSLTA